MRESGAGCSCWIVYSTNGDDNIGKKGGNKEMARESSPLIIETY